MGSVWKGSGLTLEKNAMAMAPVPDRNIFNKKELAAINIAKKVLLLCSMTTHAHTEVVCVSYHTRFACIYHAKRVCVCVSVCINKNGANTAERVECLRFRT